MNQPLKNPIIEQLIDSQIAFLEDFFNSEKDINNEVLSLYHWLSSKKIKEFGTPEPIYHCIKKQMLDKAIPSILLETLVQHIHFSAVYSPNKNTKISHIIDVMTVDRLAQFIANKETSRQAFIHFIIHHPSFSTIMSQLVQQAIQQYFEDNLSSKISSMSKVMKVGKSVFENMTDATLEKTISQYVEKNILKLGQMSEHVLNKHLTNDRLYHLQAELWHQVKDTALSQVTQPLSTDNLPELVDIINDFWNAFRQTNYAKTGLQDSLNTWYDQNKEHTLSYLFQVLNIDEAFLQEEFVALFKPIVAQLISEGYIKSRIYSLLANFYYHENTLKLLKQI